MQRHEASPTRPEASPTRPVPSASRPVPSASRPEASPSRPGLAVSISTHQVLIDGPLGAGHLSEIKIKDRIFPVSAPPQAPFRRPGTPAPARGSCTARRAGSFGDVTREPRAIGANP